MYNQYLSQVDATQCNFQLVNTRTIGLVSVDLSLSLSRLHTLKPTHTVTHTLDTPVFSPVYMYFKLAASIQWTGPPDWITGLDYWTHINLLQNCMRFT